MTTQRRRMIAHAGPLFITAFGGWSLFHLVNGGGYAYVLPGVIVAALLAYAGAKLALRLDDRARTASRAAVAAPLPMALRILPPRPASITTFPTRQVEYMDMAAGD